MRYSSVPFQLNLQENL